MTEDFFLIILGNFICPVMVYIVCEKVKNHSSKKLGGGKKSGIPSHKKRRN